MVKKNRVAYRFIGGLAALLLGVGAVSASAQNTTGTIRGTVTGAGVAPVPDAQIGARIIETGAQRGASAAQAVRSSTLFVDRRTAPPVWRAG